MAFSRFWPRTSSFFSNIRCVLGTQFDLQAKILALTTLKIPTLKQYSIELFVKLVNGL
jgi:hypothetical protein